MSVRIASRWVSLNVLLGFVLFVGGEHFYLPKENNVFSNDPQDDWVPISGIDKRSTRPNHGVTKIVHITPPVRFPHRSSDLQLQAMSASNKVEVFAQPPPTVLGSFTEFGHSTVEAREPAHALNFRPSYHFERQHRDEINDRRYQEPEEQTHPSVVVFNAQQRHPQNYLKPTPPQQYYQNYVPYYNGNGNNNNKNFGFKEPPAVVQEAQIVPKRLTPYSVSNDHVFPRPQQQQLHGNSKLQAYAEQRPPKHPYPVNPAEQQLQRYQQPQHQQQQQKQQQHYQQTLQQQQQQQQHNQKQPYRTSAAEGAVQSSAYFHKYYPGQVIDGQNPFPEVSNFARPFEQITTNDHDVYIRPNQQVHNLNVGTEVRFGPEPSTRATALQQEPTTGGVTHPATRPFSKYQTPSPKNEELYRIFPVKEVNALPPAFLPTPIAPHTTKAGNGRPKAPNDVAAAAAAVGSSEYDESQNENDSGEQYYDIVRSRTKPMMTTTTTATTTTTTTTTSAPPRSTRKKKPSTTTAAAPPDEYDEYAAAVHNRQQLQLQEHDEHQPQQHAHGREPTAAEPNGDVPPQPPAVSVNKYKKKKPLPAARPKEPVRPERPNESPTERAAAADPPPTVSSSTAVAATAAAAPATTVPSDGGGVAEAATAADARAKAKLKYANGTRPRFSIKDYRTTTAPSTAAAPTEAAPTDTATGGRKPYKPRTNRYRTSAASRATEEPPAAETTTMTMTTTTTSTTDRNAYRSKYKPGKYYSRSRTTTSTESAAAAAADETATVATAEPTRPAAVYSAKRRTVAARTTASPAEENSAALRRGSSAAPLIGGGAEETLGAASSEDADYATTAVAAAVTRPKYQAADRPLLPIESFFQSSMGGKRHRHSERR